MADEQVLEVGGALDSLSSARSAGYEWTDIHDHLQQGRANATANGYGPEEIDKYEGWAPWKDAFKQPWAERLSNSSAITTPQTVRSDYARAVLNNQVKSPKHFAESYISDLEGVQGKAFPDKQKVVEELTDALPSIEELTDHSIKAAINAGGMSLPMVQGARETFLKQWAGDGRDLADIAENGPLPKADEPHPLTPHISSVVGEELGSFLGDFLNGTGDAAKTVASYTKELAETGEKGAKRYGETAIRNGVLGMIFKVPTELAGILVKDLVLDPLGEGLHVTENVLAGKGFTREESYGVTALMLGGSTGFGGLGAGPRLPAYRLNKTATKLDTVGPIEDVLHQAAQTDVADKLDMLKWSTGLKPNQLTSKFAESAYKDIEKRLTDGPDHELAPETQEFLQAVKPLLDRRFAVADRLSRKVTPELAEQLGLRDILETGGHLDGIITRKLTSDNYFGPVDAATGARLSDVVTGAPEIPPASRLAAHEDRYVLERTYKNSTGERVFSPNTLAKTEAEYGRKLDYGDVVESLDKASEKWTVRRPTTEEIEKNVTDTEGNPLTFHKNFLANTMDQTVQLQRVDRSLDLLERLKKDLREKDLLHRKVEDIPVGKDFQGEAAEWTRLDIPQLEGYYVPKRIAEPLNDFYAGREANLSAMGKLYTRINRFFVGALFATPFPHIANVGMHWMVGRGLDWVNPAGWARLFTTGARAITAVRTMNADYTRMLRQGSGLMRGSVDSGNFHSLLMEKLFNEQLADPAAWAPLANRMGWEGAGASAADRSLDAVRQMVKAEYSWSRRTLWAANDMFMLQRQFELEAKGFSSREAIRMAEKDIPNYRVPSRVLDSRAVSEALTDPNLMNFGRYKYGQINALGQILPDMLRGTGRERLDAAAKLVILGGMAFGAYPLLDKAMQYATGNPYAHAHRAGPFSLIDSIYSTTPGQKDWGNRVSSFLSLPPAQTMAVQLLSGKNGVGQDIFSGDKSLTGVTSEAAQFGASQFYPLQLAIELAKGNGESEAYKALGLGVSPDQDVKSRQEIAQRYAPRRLQAREKHNKLKGVLDRIFSWSNGSAAHSPPTEQGSPNMSIRWEDK